MAPAGFRFGGGILRGSGRSPANIKELSKICKKVFGKLQKMHYFSHKFFKTMREIFARLGKNTRGRKILINFWQKVVRKMQKMYYFSIFSRYFKNQALNFRAFGRKTQRVGKFWKNLRSLKKIAKMHFLSICFKEFEKPRVDFSHVWTKNTSGWENFKKSLNFWKKIQ